MNAKDRATLQAMIDFGSPFVKALAHATLLAPSADFRRVKEGWPKVWAGYAKIVVEMRKLELLKKEVRSSL